MIPSTYIQAITILCASIRTETTTTVAIGRARDKSGIRTTIGKEAWIGCKASAKIKIDVKYCKNRETSVRHHCKEIYIDSMETEIWTDRQNRSKKKTRTYTNTYIKYDLAVPIQSRSHFLFTEARQRFCALINTKASRRVILIGYR